MNETDFRIDIEYKYKVIIRTDNIIRYLSDLNNRDYYFYRKHLYNKRITYVNVRIQNIFSIRQMSC